MYFMEEKLYKPKEISDMAGVTVRTLQYYDKIDLLKPSYKNENGYRFYTEEDLMELQKVISLKFLGFSIEDIKKLLASETSEKINLIKEKKKLLEHQIRNLTLINKSLEVLDKNIEHENEIDWCEIAGNVKNMRIKRHKEVYGKNIRDKENQNMLHGELIDILIEILKNKGDKEKENVLKLKEHMDKMVKGNNGINLIIENLQEISDIPGKMRGISAKDALTLIDKIKSHIN